MKIRKRCKVRGNALVNKMRKMADDYNRFMKENFSDSSFNWEPNTVEDYALWRFNSLVPSYDESVQDEVTRPFANFKDGMTRVYRRFRRTNIYIFCYERPFVKVDHQWFTFLRDSPSVVFADDIREAMEIQYAGSLFRKLKFNLHPFQIDAIKLMDKTVLGSSHQNTLFMKRATMCESQISQDMTERTRKKIYSHLGVSNAMIVCPKNELTITVAKNRFPKEGERPFTYDMVDRLTGPSGDFHGE